LTAGVVLTFFSPPRGARPPAPAAGASVFQPKLFSHRHHATPDGLLASLWVSVPFSFPQAPCGVNPPSPPRSPPGLGVPLWNDRRLGGRHEAHGLVLAASVSGLDRVAPRSPSVLDVARRRRCGGPRPVRLQPFLVGQSCGRGPALPCVESRPTRHNPDTSPLP